MQDTWWLLNTKYMRPRLVDPPELKVTRIWTPDDPEYPDLLSAWLVLPKRVGTLREID